MHANTRPTLRPLLSSLLCASLLLGCSSFGSKRLEHDQVDYARAIDRAQKRQTLANIVALRYADTPTFLPVTQVIAAYSFEGSVSGSISGIIGGDADASGTVGAGAGYSNRPTFTFSPVNGEEFAQSYIRPLSPALVLPLAQSGVPIDLLLRIVAQSVGDLHNSAALSGPSSAGSAGFFEMIHLLRSLQLKGALTVRFARDDSGNRVFLAIDPTHSDDDEIRKQARRVQQLLHLQDADNEFEIVYGAAPKDRKAISIVTRSVLGILTELGAQIDVPEADVNDQATVATVRMIGVETRPTIAIHVGESAPKDAYATIRYGQHDYWIERRDFDSKFAFSVVQNLMALAESSQNGKVPIVTIPAN